VSPCVRPPMDRVERQRGECVTLTVRAGEVLPSTTLVDRKWVNRWVNRGGSVTRRHRRGGERCMPCVIQCSVAPPMESTLLPVVDVVGVVVSNIPVRQSDEEWCCAAACRLEHSLVNSRQVLTAVIVTKARHGPWSLRTKWGLKHHWGIGERSLVFWPVRSWTEESRFATHS